MIPKEILVILLTFGVGLYLYVPVLAAIKCKTGTATITDNKVTAPTATEDCSSDDITGCMTEDKGKYLNLLVYLCATNSSLIF